MRYVACHLLLQFLTLYISLLLASLPDTMNKCTRSDKSQSYDNVYDDKKRFHQSTGLNM
jgi:hypothetical protein